MATHKCVIDCYFKDRLYKAGELVDFDKSVKPPNYFQPLKGAKKDPEPKKSTNSDE